MISTKKISILNSRQGLHPCRSHLWVKKTLEALSSIKSLDPIIVSSLGMSTWDILTVKASQLDLELELYIQIDKNSNEQDCIAKLVSEYKLNPQLVKFNCIFENSVNTFQTLRDISITDTADEIFPVSIRPKGNLENLLLKNKPKIDNKFSIPFNKRNEKIAYRLTNSKLTDNIQEISNDFIIHWTKTPKNKWYHENFFDYYTAILESDSYPRKAKDSLQNIIKLKRIFASPTHMPQNIPTVSFTSLNPIEMIPFFKWRSRYHEMSFEPYGIGIKKDIALSRNIQKVIYYEKDNPLENKADVWLTQSKGMQTDWETEYEYRHLGNFNLDDISNQNIILFTHFKKEADQLEMLTGYKTISFTE